MIKSGIISKTQLVETYLCIIVYFIKAVHLKLVTDKPFLIVLCLLFEARKDTLKQIYSKNTIFFLD